MSAKKTPLEVARLEPEAFHKRVAKLEALHRAEAAAGADALLAGGDTADAQAADTITKAASEVRLIEAGIRGLREQRAAALASDRRRQAAALRSQANEKRRQQADLAARGRNLLDDRGRIETEGLPAAGEARAGTPAGLLAAVTAQGDRLPYPALAAIDPGTSSLWVAQRYFRATGEGNLTEPAS